MAAGTYTENLALTKNLTIWGAGSFNTVGGGPHVRGFTGFDTVYGTSSPTAPSFFAYDPAFRGGVFVALGSLDGEKRAIITGPGAGGGPHVRAFGFNNVDLGVNFFAYAPAFTGGVRVASCDVDGDGKAEIITAPGPPGGPHVRVWKVGFPGGAVSELVGFFAYSPAFAGGVFVACGDVDGDSKAEILTAPDAGGGPHVRVWKVTGTTVTEQVGFFAYNPAFSGGVRVAAVDVDGDGRAEIITGAGPGGGPHVRVFKVTGTTVSEAVAFFAYDQAFRGGVFVAGHRVDFGILGGGALIVTGAGAGGGPHVRVVWVAPPPPLATPVAGFFAYDPAFRGGVTVASGN